MSGILCTYCCIDRSSQITFAIFSLAYEFIGLIAIISAVALMILLSNTCITCVSSRLKTVVSDKHSDNVIRSQLTVSVQFVYAVY